MHAATLSRDMKHFVDKFSSAGQPMVVRLCSSADGAVLSVLFECVVVAAPIAPRWPRHHNVWAVIILCRHVMP